MLSFVACFLIVFVLEMVSIQILKEDKGSVVGAVCGALLMSSIVTNLPV